MTPTKKILTGLFALLAVTAFAAPQVSHAENYAFVSTGGEVRMIAANNPTLAIETAPDRHLHSGVILLDSLQDSGLLGTNIND
jgi:hypothetical protein